MAMTTKARARFGYLNYELMLSYLKDGKLDAYDINFAPDTKECYVITPELIPWSIKSRVYTFDDEAYAIEALNQNTDTYAGQIVAILSKDVYKAYIVNKNETGFFVTPLSDINDEIIDYDNLGNKPIINLVGTLDYPIAVDTLDSGIYLVKGQYSISGIDTIFLSASNVVFLVEKSENSTVLKKITSSEIINYSITDGVVTQDSIITSSYLEERGFATNSYVDNKIAALDFVTKEEVSEYVDNLISNALSETIDFKIEEKLAEKESEFSDIDALF